MFKARQLNNIVEEKDNCFTVDLYVEVETSKGWKYADKLNKNDVLLIEEDGHKTETKVKDIKILSDKILIYFE